MPRLVLFFTHRLSRYQVNGNLLNLKVYVCDYLAEEASIPEFLRLVN